MQKRSSKPDLLSSLYSALSNQLLVQKRSSKPDLLSSLHSALSNQTTGAKKKFETRGADRAQIYCRAYIVH